MSIFGKLIFEYNKNKGDKNVYKEFEEVWEEAKGY